jgi:molybdopterin-guanine dinucleotide biosynthesis protein A
MGITAAILAGGRATRFGGRAKNSLIVEGRSILDRQLDVLGAVADEVLIVGGQISAPGARTIDDAIPGCGPLGGLHAALTESTGAVTLLVACDMPFLSEDLLRYLATLASTADAVVPRTEGGYHPLCAAYAPACLGPAAAHLASGRMKMIDLLDDVKTRVVSDEELNRFGDPRRLMSNLNTPAEYAAAIHGHGR